MNESHPQMTPHPRTCPHRHGLAITLALFVATGCQLPTETNQKGEQSPWPGFQPLTAMQEGPTYHLLAGYDPVWLDYVKEGVERARSYWGSYGPTHVWILGCENGDEVNEDAKSAFIEEYCAWRTATSSRTIEECRPHAQERFFDVIKKGEAEAYLSGIRDTDPHKAELIFINVHKWYYPRDPIPDPVLRGIHEYTHVFQQSVGAIPTWMAEGGAVFMEVWLPHLDGKRKPDFFMRRLMGRARRIKDPSLTIADMEEIEAAPKNVAKYHRELAYDSGAWATAFMIHQSPTKGVATLRDDFYPLVAKRGWEDALCSYVGVRNKEEFYRSFEAFMDLSIKQQLALLNELKP